MSSKTVTTPSTAARTISRVVALAAVGTLVWFAYKGISNMRRNAHFSDRTVAVQQLLNEGKYDEANEFFERYDTEGLLKPEDAARLEVLVSDGLDKKELATITQKLDDRLKALDLPEAERILSNAQPRLPHDEYAKLQEKISVYSEPAMFQRITAAPDDERATLTTQYLTLYPEGLHQPQIQQYALMDAWTTVVQAFGARSSMSTVLERLGKIDALAEHSTLKLPAPFSLEEFSKVAADYAAQDRFAMAKKPDHVGEEVRFARSQYPSNPNYAADRDQVVPIGTMGLVHALSDPYVYVKLPSAPEWKTHWRLAGGYGPDVVSFAPEELEVLVVPSPTQRHILRTAIDQTIQNLKPHVSGGSQ